MLFLLKKLYMSFRLTDLPQRASTSPQARLTSLLCSPSSLPAMSTKLLHHTSFTGLQLGYEPGEQMSKPTSVPIPPHIHKKS